MGRGGRVAGDVLPWAAATAMVLSARFGPRALVRRTCWTSASPPRPGQAAPLARPAAGRGPRHGKTRAFYATAMAPIPPPDHPDFQNFPPEEVQPFANQNGGVDVDTLPPPRLFCYGPAASPLAREFAVDCGGWHAAAEGSQERRDLVHRVLGVVRKYGFAVAENMVPPEGQRRMEQEAIQHFEEMPEGFFTSPLRADRSQVHVPYREPWSADWLAMNDLVLQVTAHYCTNNMACGRTEDEQQAAWCQWVVQGADIDFFQGVPPQPGPLADNPPHGCTVVGSVNPEDWGPWLGRVMITKTPGRTPLMTRHRDIILPGPCAQLTIGVPLTPLVANNGPLGIRPGSHCMNTPGYEVVTNIPPGAIMLYDSFVDHRAMENHLGRDRYVLYYEFETRGVFTGYVEGHFGEEARKSEYDFRRVVDPVLRRHWADAQMEKSAAQ